MRLNIFVFHAKSLAVVINSNYWQQWGMSMSTLRNRCEAQPSERCGQYRLRRIHNTNAHFSTTSNLESDDDANKSNGKITRKIDSDPLLEPEESSRVSMISSDVHINKSDDREAEINIENLSPQELIEYERDFLAAPTNCCRSGCPTCVWIEYVERLSRFYSNPSLSHEKIHKDVESIDDPSIKAWIIMELKGKGLW